MTSKNCVKFPCFVVAFRLKFALYYLTKIQNMRVFVTGVTGFVGSAVVRELIGAGHQVLGLARSDAGAQSLIAAGAQVHRGDLTDLESLRSGAAMADGVIHTGFVHDFTKFNESCEVEKRVLEALGSVLAGSNRPLIISSGTGLFKGGILATEDCISPSSFSSSPRIISEEMTVLLTERGVCASAVRLPQVHGEGDHGFVSILIKIAREKGVSAYIGEGLNHWPSVHRFDAALLYRLAFEKGIAGARYHAVAEEGIPLRDIAGIIGKHLNVPVVSKSVEEAAAHFDWFSYFAAIDNRASSERTREQLGWHPTQIGLLEDLDQGHYFGS